jgi:hypothetical protein
MALINRFNFIVWQFNAAPEPEDLYNLPQGGFLGKRAATVVLVPGEVNTFYINPTTAMGIGEFDIHLRSDALKPVMASIGTVTAVPVGGINQYKATITVPAGLKEDYYRLVIQSESSGINWVSNRLLYLKSGYEHMSAVFSFRNRRKLAHIPYEKVGMTDFRQVLRLKCSTSVPQPDTEIEDYQQVTTGIHVPVMIKQDLVVGFQTPVTDAIGHEGWSTLLRHKDILINNEPYSIKTGYQSGNDHRRLSEGSFEMYQTAFSEVNRC